MNMDLSTGETMSTTPSYPETAIETAGNSYRGWVAFTRFTRLAITVITLLLAVMAATLV